MPYSPLPYNILQRALSCDPAALLQIVQLYNAYINRLATKIPRFQIPYIQDAKEKQP